MGRGKKYQPEQVVNLLRQIEVAVANGKTTPQACKDAGIVEQTYFRWRKEYGGLQVDQAKRLKELEQEKSKLKRLAGKICANCRLSLPPPHIPGEHLCVRCAGERKPTHRVYMFSCSATAGIVSFLEQDL